jgi:hypothetical protein
VAANIVEWKKVDKFLRKKVCRLKSWKVNNHQNFMFRKLVNQQMGDMIIVNGGFIC